ncbi:MAG: CoA-binding protein [Dehalococcoidia bacterium]|nr:CoA-binding protein [Dehalococcoidia bacterium]
MHSRPDKGSVRDLRLIFHPRSIAVVGVSSDEARVPALWFRALLSSGFQGKVYAVNRKGGRFQSQRVWPSLTSIPGPVDLVISCIPRESVVDLLRDCAEKRVKCVQFYTAGFSESGEAEWADAEREMVRIAQQGGFRIIGPNCFGVYNPRYGIPYGPFNVMPSLGTVGLIVQSGGIMGKILEYGMVCGLGFGKGISIGNASDIGVADVLEYLALEDEIKTVGLYLEGPRDTRHLFEVIRATAEIKPVVVWKGGGSPAGDQAIFFHTGALASSPAVWSGALRQAGALEARSLDEMCDTLLLLDRFGRLSRGNLGAICGLTDGGGGEAVLISDVCNATGVEVPHLRKNTAKALVDAIGQVGSVLTNPVDMSQRQAIAPAVRQALGLVASEPQIDIILVYENAGVLLDVYPREVTNAVNRAFLDFSQERQKPLVLVLPPGPAEARRREIERAFRGAGVPILPNVERAARAIKNIIR